MVFHKLDRLSKSGVISDEIAKIVITPDHADLLLGTVEKLEAAIRPNYSRDIFELTKRLYTEDELQNYGQY